MVFFWYYSGINGTINGNMVIHKFWSFHSLPENIFHILPYITPIFPFPSAFGPSSSNAQGYGDLHLVDPAPGLPPETTRYLKGRDRSGKAGLLGLLLWKNIPTMEKNPPTLLKKLGILLYGKSRFIS